MAILVARGNCVWVLVDGVLRLRRGRRRSATTAMRGMATERGQQLSAQANLEKLIAEHQDLEQERDDQIVKLESSFDPQRLALERIELKPRKADIEVDSVELVWLPCCVDSQGHAEPLYENSLPHSRVENEVTRTGSLKAAATGEPLARG